MRIIEYAKEHNLSARDVIDTLRLNGHLSVSDQWSELNTDMTALLNRTIGGEAARARMNRYQGQGGDAARKPRPPRPFGESSTQAPGQSFTRTPRPVTGQAPTEGGAKPADGSAGDRRPTWRKPAAPGARPESLSAATPLVDRKGASKKSTTGNKKRATKKKDEARDDATEQLTAQQQSNRTNKETLITPALVESVTVQGDMLLVDAASLMKKMVSEVIFVLLKNGVAKNIHAVVVPSDMKILCDAFGIKLTIEAPTKKDATVMVEGDRNKSTVGIDEQRLPVVVVMGHVDHGKTTLLDYLRKTNVVAKEKGGITQHLSAYEVKTGSSSSIFLDTPGHEAFSGMRTRGTRITDIAIIIVAVNDGIKPQTIEAIKLAKQAEVPMVVAINKIDKLDSQAQIEALYTQLAQQGLTPEEWGGDTVCVKISAKTGQGVSDLLDMLGLMADMLDLKTSTTAPARAFVLETRQLKGHGLAVTVICREGTLRKGDHFICGQTTGKVRLLIDSFGAFVNEAGPSIPVQVIGFDDPMGVGDYLEVVSAAQYQEARAHFGDRIGGSVSSNAPSLAHADSDKPFIRLMFKSDMQGSCQAISDAILKMSQSAKNKSLRVELISCEVGPIVESDVIRAADTGAHLFGLHVKADKNAQITAKQRGVNIVLHEIIYHLFEQVEDFIKTERRKIVHLVEAGKAEVLKIFPIKGQKVIAGCLIKEGILKIGDKVVCIRAREEVGHGKVVTLQRDRKDAKEIHAGLDCGLLTDTFHGWAVGDRVTIFTHQREED